MKNVTVITDALRMLGVLRANQQARAEDAALGLAEFNDLMSDLERDPGANLGFYPQTNINDECPLSDTDISTIKPLLAVRMRTHFPSAEPPPDLDIRASNSLTILTRAAVLENAEEVVFRNIPMNDARRLF